MFVSKISLTIASGAAESEAFSLADLVGDAGLVRTPAAWTAAGIGFKVSDSFAGTFAPLRGQAGSLVEISNVQAAEAGWYKLPDELRGALYVKLWSENAGVDANQAADRALAVVAKG
jgi:hypothetical protein